MQLGSRPGSVLLSRPQVEPCGLRGVFEQSDQLGALGRQRIHVRVTGDKSRTCATRATDVISERKHCSRRRRHAQVEPSLPRKNADNRK